MNRILEELQDIAWIALLATALIAGGITLIKIIVLPSVAGQVVRGSLGDRK